MSESESERQNKPLNAGTRLAEKHSHRDIGYYAYPVDDDPKLVNIVKPPSPNVRGRILRTAVAEIHVVQWATTSGIESLIETELDRHDSLADLEEFRLLADTMTELCATITPFSDRSLSVDNFYDLFVEASINERSELFSEGVPDDLLEDIRELLRMFRDKLGQEALRPVNALATGIGLDEEDPYMILALVHDSPGQARENVDA